jgi:hypothetical protein
MKVSTMKAIQRSDNSLGLIAIFLTVLFWAVATNIAYDLSENWV